MVLEIYQELEYLRRVQLQLDNKNYMTRESLLEKEEGEVCGSCRERKLSVSTRTNNYAEDVGCEEGAKHTVCDECDYENTMDI